MYDLFYLSLSQKKTTIHSQNHRVLGGCKGDIAEVAALILIAIAAADEEEALDVAGLDSVNDLVGHAQHRVVAEADGDGLLHLAGLEVSGKALHGLSLLDDSGEVLVACSVCADVLHVGPAHSVGRVDAVLVAPGKKLEGERLISWNMYFLKTYGDDNNDNNNNNKLL